MATIDSVKTKMQNLLSSLSTKMGTTYTTFTAAINALPSKKTDASIEVNGRFVDIPAGIYFQDYEKGVKYVERASTEIVASDGDEGDIQLTAHNNQGEGYVSGGDSIDYAYVNLEINGKTAKASVGGKSITKDVPNVSGSIGGTATAGKATGVITNMDKMTVVTSPTGTAGVDYFRVAATATGTAGSYTPKYTVSTAGYIGSTVTGTAQTVSVTGDTTGQKLYIPKAKFEVSGKSVKTTSSGGGYIPAGTTVGSVAEASRASTTLKSTTSNNTLVLTASNPQTTGYVTADTSKDTATKTVSLSVSGATVTASDGSNEISKSVSTVGRASTSITTTADDTNDKLTITASNNQGTGYVTGSNQTASKVITLTVSGATVTATDNSSTPVKISKSVTTASRASTTLTSAKSNNTLVFTAGNNQGTGYVTGSNSTASKTVSLSTSGATVTASDGTNSISTSVTTVTRAGTSITTTADDTNDKLTLSASNNQVTGYVTGSNQTASKVVTLSLGAPSISSSGLITATATATDNSTTPVKVSKSATNQLSVQATKYITPTTTTQVAVESGRYTTGKVYVYGDSYLKAENIKKGISIFGVAGSYEGSGGSSNPDAVPATCTLYFVMDDYSPVAIACTQITSSGVNAYYKALPQNSATSVANVVCGSTLLMEDTDGDGLYFSGSGEQCVQTGTLPNGNGRIYRTPATSGTYYFYFDRS